MKKLIFGGGGGEAGGQPHLAHVTSAMMLYICAKFGRNRFSSFRVYKEQTNQHIYNGHQTYIYVDIED